MTKTKKKKEDDTAFSRYVAEILQSYEITPEKRAAARAQLKKDAERARAAGAYDRLIALHEQSVRERANSSMLRDGEPYDARHIDEPEDSLAFYRSIQLTPEQKTELRAQAKKDAERAAAAGVYQRLIETHERAVRERASERKVRRKK
jgi:hypothetical protein